MPSNQSLVGNSLIVVTYIKTFSSTSAVVGNSHLVGNRLFSATYCPPCHFATNYQYPLLALSALPPFVTYFLSSGFSKVPSIVPCTEKKLQKSQN